MRILVNASNLHAGGGVAVAASVVDEFSRIQDGQVDFTVVVSSDVDENLSRMGTDTAVFSSYRVFDTVGIAALWKKHPFRKRDFDVVLNVFGPCYHIDWARGSVMGFAQPWVAFPRNLAYSRLSLSRRARSRLRFAAIGAFFLLAGTLVVEQQAIKDALLRRRLFARKRIEVVASAVDSVYFAPQRWEPVELPHRDGRLRLGVVARSYPHKNLGILPEVKRILRDDHGVDAAFLVTLPDAEWATQSADFRDTMENVGPLTLPQCPTFNSQLDAVVFPTLLECFSATPIEARAVGTPLFASDLDVVRETVGDYAVYFDPLDAQDIAAKIAGRFGAHDVGGADVGSRNQTDFGSLNPASERARNMLEVCVAASRAGMAGGLAQLVESR